MTIIKRERKFAAAIFDLDDTLYRTEEIPKQVKQNIIGVLRPCLSREFRHLFTVVGWNLSLNDGADFHRALRSADYTIKYLGVPAEEAEDRAVKLYKEYGTTMAGLVACGHNIDFDHWHREVHGTLPYDEYLAPDTRLRELLCSIELPRFVFTNADERHATTCLDKLGIADCFQGTVHFESLQHQAAVDRDKVPHTGQVQCKPNTSAFLLAMHQLGMQQVSPRDVIFMDDSVRNVTSAHRLGMFSVLVGQAEIPEGAECDLAVENVMNLHTAAPWLFNNPSLAIDDSTTAFSQLPGASAMWRGPSACAAEAEHPQDDDMADDIRASTEVARVDAAAVRA